jgi:hypothetical protein
MNVRMKIQGRARPLHEGNRSHIGRDQRDDRASAMVAQFVAAAEMN